MSTTPLSSLSAPLNGAPKAPHRKRKFLVVSQWRTVHITKLDKRKQITLGWVSSTE